MIEWSGKVLDIGRGGLEFSRGIARVVATPTADEQVSDVYMRLGPTGSSSENIHKVSL